MNLCAQICKPRAQINTFFSADYESVERLGGSGLWKLYTHMETHCNTGCDYT